MSTNFNRFLPSVAKSECLDICSLLRMRLSRATQIVFTQSGSLADRLCSLHAGPLLGAQTGSQTCPTARPIGTDGGVVQCRCPTVSRRARVVPTGLFSVNGPFAKACSPLIRHRLFNDYKLWRSDQQPRMRRRCAAACASVWNTVT